MAAEKFGPHLKTILKGKHVDTIYELWGVSYAVEIELPEDAEKTNIQNGSPGELGRDTGQLAPRARPILHGPFQTRSHPITMHLRPKFP
ncbi:hypothetical protein F2Q69_00020525 [Brassica cretica]|uniref:Uncharacterized protein n=1 Tax=Brassica cretica TaxID=69181 RepID=A0A8S9QD40_BRACR|nr:hypothetical protein F2Q69_00020525 [Brassica cretica]